MKPIASIKNLTDTNITLEEIHTETNLQNTKKLPKEDLTDLLSSSPLSSTDLFIGSMFENKYLIEKKIGNGGMGVVYQAKHTFMDRRVAIKLLKAELLDDSSFIEYFKREARAAGRIQHPNATAVLDFGVSNNMFYLVMEHLEGQTLRARLSEKPRLSIEETLSIITKVCEAISAAHSHNVLHCDLKPDNIFLQSKENCENVKVLDFGIAKIMQDPTTPSFMSRISNNSILGTPQYMSPEQCQGDPLSWTTDIYSLGIITFEMLTGQLPFDGNSVFSIAFKQLSESAPKPSEINPELPIAIDEVILRALAKKPEARQQSALQFAKELNQAWEENQFIAPLTGLTKPLVKCTNNNCLHPELGENGRCLKCQMLLVGTLLRYRYEVRQLAGKGGFGIAYLVIDQDCFDEVRILKESQSLRLEDDFSEKDYQTTQKIFKREAEALLNLQHRGIPKLYAYFLEGNYSYLVQEFIPGQTISEEMKKRSRPFTEQEVIDLLTELADILGYLHNHTPEIIHRDIKPQNLMRHAKGHLMLIDFGAVCLNNMSTKTYLGSPGFSPVEQIFGSPTPQSDLYAVASTLINLLSGISPHRLFNHETMQLEWENHIKISPEFTNLIKDMLKIDLSQRLTSVNELKNRLKTLPKPNSVVNQKHKSQLSLSNLLSINKETVETIDYQEAQISYRNSKPPEQTGNLDITPLPFLLNYLNVENFSGQLTCIKDSIKNIYFEEGKIVFASSSTKTERLGELLIRMNRITRSDYQKASDLMKNQGIRFGTAVILLGFISKDELQEFILKQVKEIIYSIFDLNEGWYEIRSYSPPEEPIKFSLSVVDVVIEGMRQMNNITLLEKWVGDLKQKLETTIYLPFFFEIANLSPEEIFIASSLNNNLSVDEIILLSGGLRKETLRIICALQFLGGLKPVQLDNRFSNPFLEKEFNDFVDLPKPDQTINIHNAATFCYEVENMSWKVENADYYNILGIENNATDQEIQKAYSDLINRFDPEAHKELTNNLVLLSQLNKIMAHLKQAYNVLSNPAMRSNYKCNLRNSGKLRLFH